MNHRTLAAIWLAAVLVAGSAAAQTSTDTRAAAAASARDEKADANTVVQKDPVERLLDLVERNSLAVLDPRYGFGVRTGGIENGSGLAAGPMWRSSTLLRGRVHAHASSAFSIARDRELEGGVAIPDFRTGRLTLGVGAALPLIWLRNASMARVGLRRSPTKRRLRSIDGSRAHA